MSDLSYSVPVAAMLRIGGMLSQILSRPTQLTCLGSTNRWQQQQERSLASSSPRALRKEADNHGGYFSSPIRARWHLFQKFKDPAGPEDRMIYRSPLVNYVQLASFGQIPALFGLALMSRATFLAITGETDGLQLLDEVISWPAMSLITALLCAHLAVCWTFIARSPCRIYYNEGKDMYLAVCYNPVLPILVRSFKLEPGSGEEGGGPRILSEVLPSVTLTDADTRNRRWFFLSQYGFTLPAYYRDLMGLNQ